LVVGQYEVATFTQRILRHPEFNTHGKRMGKVIRATRTNISVWLSHAEKEVLFDWAK
jgi:hypothetical protein